MSAETSPQRLAGQLLVGGFPGVELPAELRAALAAGERGGVIFFKRNLPDLETTARLTAEVRAETARGGAPPPWLGVDEEGGRVRRLPSPFRSLPPMRVLGEWNDAALTERLGRALGTELRALGFNLDFAPVADVDTNPLNPIIGDRAFSREPLTVATHAAAFTRGLQAAGVSACAKHFPGHGDTALDSHLALPVIAHGKARLAAVELLPFRRLAAEVDAVMSAHLVAEALDASTPATLSPRVMTRLLRDEVGFRGVAFSDDLEMGALADESGPWCASAGERAIEHLAVAAVLAGCDALLVCSSLELQARAHEALTRECERSPAFAERAREAYGRGIGARERRAAPPPDRAQRDAARQELTRLDTQG